MVDFAIKILAIIGGIIAGFMAYDEFNVRIIALLAFFGAVAVGIIAGVLLYYVLNWLLSSIRGKA